MKEALLAAIIYCTAASIGAVAGDVPDIKAGLWSTTTNMGDSKIPPQSGSMCTSTALLQQLYDERLKNPDRPCKRVSMQRVGSTITELTECKFGNRVTRSKSVSILTGNTAIHSEMRDEGKDAAVISDSKYVGACPVGMQLGDFVSSTGMKFNVLHPENVKMPAKTP